MSLNTLRMAAGFLQASQLGVELAGRNIAGADEVGYTRQNMHLSAIHVDNNGRQTFEVGLGVRVQGFDRVRDGFLDAGYRSNLGESKAAESLEGLMARLESATTSLDLSGSVNSLRQAYAAAAQNPEEQGVMQEALSRTDSTVSSLRTMATEISNLSSEATARQKQSVDEWNRMLSELADLNTKLPLGGRTGGQNALRDQRDLLLDEISKYASVQVRIDGQDRAAVYLDGREVVFGDRYDPLAVDAQGNLVDPRGSILKPKSGELEGLRGLIQDTLPNLTGQLDSLAVALRDELNTVHRSGYASDGVAGRDLLSGSGALDLKLVITDPSRLAVAGARMESTAAVGTGPVTSDVALASQPLATAPSANGTIEINGHAITWDSSQSLDDILGSFQAAGVEATWNPVSQRVLLKRLPDGQAPTDITVTDASGNLAASLGLSGATFYKAFDGSSLKRMGEVLGENRFGGDSLSGKLDAMASQVGSLKANATLAKQSAQRLSDTALERRQQVAGVSVDEELMNLTRFEQAFAAAARLANVADEMLSTVISMGAR